MGQSSAIYVLCDEGGVSVLSSVIRLFSRHGLSPAIRNAEEGLLYISIPIRH